MAWGYRASSYASNGAGAAVGSGSTTTVTLGAALSAGDVIVLGIAGFTTNGTAAIPTFAVSDSVNGSWGSAQAATVTDNTTYPPNAGRNSVWVRANSGAGTPVITVTPTFTGGGTANIGLQVLAGTGLATASVVDTTAATEGTGSSPSSGNVSPATGAASEMMVGCYLDWGEGTTLSAGNINGAAATLAGKHDADGGRWQGLMEYADSGSSGGTPSATASSTGTPGTWGMFGVVLNLAASAAVPPGLGPVVGLGEAVMTAGQTAMMR